uniref:Uncharacterized protein n=1 Tax=Arundo donax TaxID=35708 RepID=A0A0A9CES8_ARUDO
MVVKKALLFRTQVFPLVFSPHYNTVCNCSFPLSLRYLKCVSTLCVSKIY